MNFFKYLCCPKCKGKLISKKDFLYCRLCNKDYQIQDGIPDFVDPNDLSDQHLGQLDYFDHCRVMTTDKYRLEAWHKSYLKRFNDNFKEIANKVILDCGTGQGYMSIELAKAGARVISCDLTLQSLARLKKIADKKGLANRIFLVRCSAEELPFKNSTVDYFVLNAILEHLEKEKETIEEINRVAKKMSGLMITVPMAYHLLNPLFVPGVFFQDKKIGHLRRYTKKDLIEKFKDFSYQLKKIYYVGHFRKVIVTLLFSQLLKTDRFTEKCEEWERDEENIRYGATNICAIFKRMHK